MLFDVGMWFVHFNVSEDLVGGGRPWSLVTDHWSKLSGPWSLVTPHCFLVSGPWTLCALVVARWSLVSVSGLWSPIPVPWSLVSGPWPLVSDPWLLVTGA